MQIFEWFTQLHTIHYLKKHEKYQDNCDESRDTELLTSSSEISKNEWIHNRSIYAKNEKTYRFINRLICVLLGSLIFAILFLSSY